MTKISTTAAYAIKEIVNLTDYCVGTDSETDKLETVSFSFESVRNFILAGLSPTTGGTLQISEISYTGVGYATPEAFINALDPNYVVNQYHLVIISFNGYKYILKLQNVTLGVGQTAISASNLIEVSTKSLLDALTLIAKKEYITIPISDLISNLTTGTNKGYFRMPFAGTVTSVKATVLVAQTAGSLLTFDINENGTSILSTKLTIDNNEKTSTTAATQPVISDAILADDAEITFDIDIVGTAGAKGAQIYLTLTRA